MTAEQQTHGFPDGYFLIRSTAANRLLDVAMDHVGDGTELILWLEKESSLVDNRRKPEADNQVFFIDTSGALCSRSAGHAIDVEDGRLVIRHRRPVSHPFPNEYSHPLPTFSYSKQTGEITIHFTHDPSYTTGATRHDDWRRKTYLLTSLPQRKPRTVLDDASQFLTSAFTDPLSLLSGKTKATPEDVFDGDIDLREDEVLEEERGEEAEVDDSPDQARKLRVIAVANKTTDDWDLHEKTKSRRRWQIMPLLTKDRATGA